MRPLVIALAFLIAAGGPALAQEGKKNAEAEKAAEAEKMVLATINGTAITMGDFYRAVDALPPQQQYVALQNREDFLDNLIKRELVFQEANKRGLADTPDVNAVMARLEKAVLIQYLLRQVIEGAETVDDAEAERFYLDNKEKFKTPEKIKASHIVLKTEEEAKTTLADLKKGQDFATLAREHSIGPRAPQGGYLGTISRGEMPLEFDQVAFDLPVDTLSDVVKTDFGYHIIKVTEQIPSKQLGYSEVSVQIQKSLSAQKQQAALQAFLEGLTEKAAVEAHPELLTKNSP